VRTLRVARLLRQYVDDHDGKSDISS